MTTIVLVIVMLGFSSLSYYVGYKAGARLPLNTELVYDFLDPVGPKDQRLDRKFGEDDGE